MKDQIDLSRMESVPVSINGHVRLRRHWCVPDADYWTGLWQHTDLAGYLNQAKAGGAFGGLDHVYRKFLPETGRVLEAGCGVGQVALGMQSLGKVGVGLDWATDTLRVAKKHCDSLQLVAGDIRAVPIADGSFDGYISLGVIEHFTEGQEMILREAFRVLKPGAPVILTVPALNSYRRWRIRQGFYAKTSTLPFFEDCYSEDELSSLLTASGFEVVWSMYYNAVMTFVQESPLRPAYRLLEGTRYPRSAVDRTLHKVLPRKYFGHMILVVARKPLRLDAKQSNGR